MILMSLTSRLGYEQMVELILNKATIRVAFSAGQILAKVDTALNMKRLKTIIFEILEKSPFRERKLESEISVPKLAEGKGARDSDTEDGPKKPVAPKTEKDPEKKFECDLEEIVPYESLVVSNETIAEIVDLFEQLTAVVSDPSSITQIPSKELPNRNCD